MSEYQYYEFRAIDHPLTDRQTRELRAVSSRATISRTSFRNHYTYGDLKANPRDLLVKYFDASLYFANWMFMEVAFRYPKGAVDAKVLRRYARGHALEVRTTGAHVVVAISVESDGETFDVADDASSWLSSLITLRADIAGGDERALYLAWLLDVQCGVIDDAAVDRDLLAAAAEGAPLATRSSRQEVERWLTGLGTADHITLLARVARGDGTVGLELTRRFQWHTRRGAPALPLRTAGELRGRAATIAERRRQADREREARERARRNREEQVARGRYLADLA